jgi:hybrid cluster-associated redox disulfide protein
MAQEQPMSLRTIEDLLTTWPETAIVFKRHNMACIGCSVSHLYTVADAAEVYQLALEEFVDELKTAINNS